MIYKMIILTEHNHLEALTDNPRNAVELWHTYLGEMGKMWGGPPKTHTMSLVTEAGGFTVQFADIKGIYWFAIQGTEQGPAPMPALETKSE